MQSVRFATLLLAAPLLLSGCNATIWGNLAMLGVTVGIFLGTVFLSRSGTASHSAASTASQTPPRG